jgi:hypothetical protein
MQKVTLSRGSLTEPRFPTRDATPERRPEQLPCVDRLNVQFDQGIATLLLQRADTFLQRAAAVKSAMWLGMTLHEIEDCLDARLAH